MGGCALGANHPVPGEGAKVRKRSIFIVMAQSGEGPREHRVGDRRVNRLIRKWLKAGVMEDGEVTRPEVGTPQGGVASPLLANIYLHYVFDLWAARWRRHHAQGNVILVRYADDVVAALNTRPMPSGFKQN